MNVRPLTPEDADTVAAIVREDEETLCGRRSHVEAEDVRAWWVRLDFDRESWLVEQSGSALGAGWFHLWGEVGHASGVVAREAKGRGIGSALAGRYEERALATGARLLRTFLRPEDGAALALFEARGFREVRRSYDMAITLEGPPPAPVVPDGLVLDVAHQQDARAFHAATMEALSDTWDFVGMPFDEWWELRKGQEVDARGPLWFVVRDADQIAAVIRNEVRRDGGFVGVLGVRRPWRGRGLGRALLYRSFGEFWRRGLTRVALDVDAENESGAARLYESAGMSIESSSLTYERAFA